MSHLERFKKIFALNSHKTSKLSYQRWVLRPIQLSLFLTTENCIKRDQGGPNERILYIYICPLFNLFPRRPKCWCDQRIRKLRIWVIKRVGEKHDVVNFLEPVISFNAITVRIPNWGKYFQCFSNLMEGIEKNLHSKNRDRFTHGLSIFRREVNDVLKVSDCYLYWLV